MNGKQLDFLDVLAVLSFLLGYENLVENREQSRQNDIGAANDKQARFLLERFDQRFDELMVSVNNIEQRLGRLEARLDEMQKEGGDKL